jgi:hypothetical protein
MGVADRLDLLDALRITSRSNAEKISSKRATSSSAAMTNDRSLKPTRSANSTLTVSQ